MPKKIEMDTLRSWLEKKQPVTVIDIRNSEERAQWSIPGSLHIDAYDDLKAGKASVLSDVALPTGMPIVAVCNAGKTSARAAEELSKRGFEALSLAGGMKAWSLAWNTADLVLSQTRITQVRRTGKGCLSYVISSGGESIVVDASLPPEIYVSIAERYGTSIRYVLETHIHADHLSRSRLLASMANAELALPEQDRVHFPHRSIQDGNIIELNSAKLQAIATPGHTLESTCYLLDGKALFTGDTLFTSNVGRPDLHADVRQTRARASLLYRSIERLMLLDPSVIVLPGHTGVPPAFDGVLLGERLAVVAGRLHDRLASEDAFVEKILAHIPPPPANFEQIVMLNEAGDLPVEDATELEAGANRCAAG